MNNPKQGTNHETCPTCGQAAPDMKITTSLGNTTLNRRNQTIEVAGVTARLTSNEFCILDALIRERGQCVDRESLQAEIDPSHANNKGGERGSVAVHINKIRKKIADSGSDIVISGVRGLGYMME